MTYSENFGGDRPRVTTETVERVRQAVESSDRSYIKASHLKDAVPDVPQTTIGDALLDLERDGLLETHSSPKHGARVYRVRSED